MTIGRPAGHLLDPLRDQARAAIRPIARMPGVRSSGVPEACDWRHLADLVLDQARSQSCVWHSVAMALYLRGRLEFGIGIGPQIPLPSVMQPWVLAQWGLQKTIGMRPEKRMATNVGSNLAAGLHEIHRFGIVSDAAWPLDPRLAWDAPEPAEALDFDLPLDIDVAAADALLTGDYGASGEDFPLVARAALAVGHFPVQAFDVCDVFAALSPSASEYRGTEGRIVRGRHMMVAVGYRPGWILYRGSYGRTGRRRSDPARRGWRAGCPPPSEPRPPRRAWRHRATEGCRPGFFPGG